MAVSFKRGQTFSFSGSITNNGAAWPIDGYTLEADIRNQTNFEFVQSLTCTILDAATGKISISAIPTDTIKWLVMPHLMDVRLTDTAGNVLISNTIEIDVLDACTQRTS
jgi:hypothetical protein